MLSKEAERNAVEVLKLIAGALRKRHKVTTKPSDVGSYRGCLTVDGIEVRFHIKERGQTYTYGRPGTATGELYAHVESIWGRLDSKSFRSAKARAETHGLDVAAICSHIELYVQTQKDNAEQHRVDDATRKKAQAAKKRLEKEFPKLAHRVLESSKHGLTFNALLSEETARDLLRVLAARGGWDA